jgi:glycosyltransferase involved in cell wall biosynthesis
MDTTAINKKPKGLLLSDDLRMHSGVATMSRELVLGTVKAYDWVQIAGAIQHPEKGKVINMDAATAQMTGVKDAHVTIYPVDGYGNEELLFAIMDREKPDFIMHFTDPRFWGWLYSLERQIRSKIPLTYYNIWDDVPYPMYNRPYYESCDLLMSISKQTYNINKWVLGPDKISTIDSPNTDGRAVLHYVPHGINKTIFYPIPDDDANLKKRKKEIFNNKNYDFVIFYNSRNVQRKRTSNIMLAYKALCDNLTPEEAAKCVLVLHTEVRQDAGTDLIAVKEAFCPNYDVIFSTSKYSPQDMNLLYNMADVTINISSNEGFGLSTAESLMSGTPIIVAVTGGLQDQIGQTKDDGSPIEFDLNFGSNNVGKYKKHGVWAYPVYPPVQCIQGSIPTPYIFDDMTRWEDAAEGLMYWYLAGPKKREWCGQQGREWALKEGGINAENMCDQFIKCMNYTLDNFKPVKPFSIFTEKDYVGNLMPGGMGFEIPKFDKDKIKQEIEKINI